MKKQFYFIILLVMCASVSWAQNKLTGRVTDSGTPLPGVSVLVKGTNSGATSDGDGRYSVNIPANATIVVSYIGYLTQEITVGNRTVIDVSLLADTKTLNEVVVTGYGVQSKKDITGAVASIDSKTLLATPITNLAQGMQGRVAGVSVSNDNSPGGGVMVRIRGFGTINDNSPLYVIDGTPTKGNLNTLNPNDIESMQILKDASAASIYGSRAGNGVVIITTKQGKAGKPKLSYDTYYGSQGAWRFLDLLNTQEYANLLWESRTNALNRLVNGVPQPGTNGSLTFPSNAQFGNGATPIVPVWILPAGSRDPNDPRAADALYSANPTSRNLITRANPDGTD